MSIAEQEKPQIHMVWPTSEHPSCPAVAPASGYTIRAFQDGDEQAFLNLMSLSDFDPWDDEKLSGNINKIIPGGWFFAVDSGGQTVATAMGQHNYSGLSPFTGDVGWVFCHPDHRGNGLGLALCARVTQRFLDAGYTKIQLHTEYYRLPAIKTYWKLGFVPVIISSKDADLWAGVYKQLNWTQEPELNIDELQQRISENPDDADAYSALGTAYTSQERFEEAIRVFEKALRLNPEDSHAELALSILVTIVEPSKDLLRFLIEHGGSMVKIAQKGGGIPYAVDTEPPTDG